MIDYLVNNFLEILGTLVGIVYLYWEYKGDIKLWIAGIIMPAISLYVYYNAGLYADFGINIYYLIVAIYGWVIWSLSPALPRRERETSDTKQKRPIIYTPRKAYLPLAVVFAVLWVVIAQILIRFTNSTVPWLDAFTTSLSIVGMWMLARKWIEQWWAWLLVDAVSAGLYVYKGIYFYAALYAIYTVVVFFGYRKWKSLMSPAAK